MKILHLIDSLNAGGAERMAVTYANALVQRGEEVWLWSTREKGVLKDSIGDKVTYSFLNRKGTVGIKALGKARKEIKKEGIQLIHAHSTSFFFATLLKLVCPGVKLVWHDHHGNRSLTKKSDNKLLISCSRFFDAVFVVNTSLKEWHLKHLKNKQVRYIPNFVSNSNLQLESNRKNTIICVANLRNPKDHETLIDAFSIIYKTFPHWQLLLAGKDKNDAYSQKLTEKIATHQLEEAVFILGERNDTTTLLQIASIGVLSSAMEGLPLALLEYGIAGLAVVTTDVGHCKEVVQDYGKVVPPKDAEALAEALKAYIQDDGLRQTDAIAFQKHILQNYTEDAVIPKVMEMYRKLEVRR